VRVAHFSDVHALDLTGVRLRHFFNKRIAGYANLAWRRRQKHPVRLFEAMVEDINRCAPDHVVVSGDLTNLSLEAEFALARRLLDRLSLGPKNVTLVPGNHDVYTFGALRERLFEKVLEPYAASDARTAVEFPLVRVRGEVAFVGVSTALPSPPPLADGWVGRAQLAVLTTRLQELEGKFRVLVLHHPPYTNRHSLLRGLRDRGRLQEILSKVGCELILHGHEHRDLRAEVKGPRGPIPVVGVGSATYDDPRADRRARYNVYRIEGRRLISVETRVHDRNTDAFVATSGA
jgi:3',5'-cyclic AMP phosphodiesterase CpdA